MTRLRKMMLEELERRNYSAGTTRRYLRFVERFAQHFGKSPDKLGPDHLPLRNSASRPMIPAPIIPASSRTTQMSARNSSSPSGPCSSELSNGSTR